MVFCMPWEHWHHVVFVLFGFFGFMRSIDYMKWCIINEKENAMAYFMEHVEPGS